MPSSPAGPQDQVHNITVERLTVQDAQAVRELSKRVYARINASWSETAFTDLIKKFPEGQIAIKNHDEVVAFAFSLIVQYDNYGDNHTYKEITGNYTFSTHDPKGDVLYGIEVCVDPKFQGLRLGRRLYDARKEICENLNLRAIIAGGRMPNYSKYVDLSPRE